MNSNLMNALLHPVHLVMLVGTVVAGLISAWWLFPLGMFFWLVMIIRYINDPAQVMNQKIVDRQPLAPRFQTIYTQVERIQVRMFNAISGASPDVRRELQPVLNQMNVLVDETYLLCLRMTPLENFRRVSDAKINLDQEYLKLTNLLTTVEDPVARKTYEETRLALQTRIEQSKQSAAQLDRTEAFLAGLVNDIDTILAQVIPLLSVKRAVVRQRTSAIIAKIDAEISELKTFGNLLA